ncbi:fused response regulator/phosphatase [Halioxenophilus aromaticivorans]|uniref:Two-component system response regulator HsbR n=1 Tax=Halioxenophilus aromaticivorans TaxID=1306992 RepID=A0AAV3TZS8_9ALTE
MLKVLIADDSETDRFLVCKLLKHLGYACESVSNGAEVLELFDKYRPDILLLDVLMPKMDGLKLAGAVKKLAGEDFIPILFLTGLHEVEFIERCLDSGGDDFITKPVNPRILKAKMSAFGRMRTMQNSLLQHRNQLRKHHQQLLEEQSVAKHVYDAITGGGSLDCGTIRHHMSSLAVFNGDVLLASIRPNGNLMLLLGDFTGHGLPAALGSMPLASSFYNMVATGFSLPDILRELNQKMSSLLPRGFFCCAIVAELDFIRYKLSVWNGGLPTGYFFQQEDDDYIPLPSTHLPLGVETGERFSDECQVLDFNEEDRLLIWTDGIYDVRNSKDERIGPDAIDHIVAQHDASKIDELFDTILMAVENHMGGDSTTDDLSLVEVLTKAPEADVDAIQQPSSHSGPLAWQFEFEIKPPTFHSLDPIPVLMTFLSQVPGLGTKATSLFTVLSELYNNALDHGLLGLSSFDKRNSEGFSNYYHERERRLKNLTDGYVRFTLRLTTGQHAGRLEVSVEDSGPGFDYQLHKQGVNNLLHGRGIDMVRQFSQSLSYEGRGNIAKAIYVWSLSG